jgi:hypothetical protein
MRKGKVVEYALGPQDMGAEASVSDWSLYGNDVQRKAINALASVVSDTDRRY